ncbi:glyoxylase-like metal-dependent hydrolase (beta-lactamase superfamily II) [Anseongella ginsenosidimutans]|uniref:Glyoxylase-like metal-dependent hydrolase (Beta-lactamase superfamily II) n=1 Tax=Anseongella ginsenosidimutans TaxID=496056 RepID=A0A4R3KVU8_9SPHI|nr:MBL fold metallo-hydrolase [Anseongella ginsenosidimutans]TCS88836.1 glyoxylase-like metal-dependent hydrolase (beta-lactamase superfamily II) [Anseongella ginsenosidimutans]
MISIKQFTFNPWAENTFILYDETRECIIIDPGCHIREEQDLLVKFIRDEQLNPVLLLNTHCHIDHVLGNKFVQEMYGLSPRFHRLEEAVLRAMIPYAASMNMPYTPSPPAEVFLEEGEQIEFGKSELKSLFTPGHSPGSLSFFSNEDRLLIGGDVLFQGSIGRTDLPGGDFDTLIRSIQVELFSLGDDVKVFPGHGPATSIGFERENNPFL